MKTKNKNLTNIIIRDKLYPNFINEKIKIHEIINNSNAPICYWIEYLNELIYDLKDIEIYNKKRNKNN